MKKGFIKQDGMILKDYDNFRFFGICSHGVKFEDTLGGCNTDCLDCRKLFLILRNENAGELIQKGHK